jgi:hypothetical protein
VLTREGVVKDFGKEIGDALFSGNRVFDEDARIQRTASGALAVASPLPPWTLRFFGSHRKTRWPAAR